MEKSIITTGKTIDDAIAAALAKLGMDRDSVSVTVLEQAKAGFFGIGRVDAKVQVTYEAPDLKPAAEPRAEEKKPGTSAPRIALSSASRSKPKAEKKPVEKKPEAPKANVAPKAEPKPVEKKAEAPKANVAPRTEPKPAEKKPEARKAEKPAAPKAPKAPKPEKKAEAPKANVAPRAERTYTPAEPGSNEEKIEVFIKDRRLLEPR